MAEFRSFLRPLLTALVFVGVTVLAFFLMSLAMDWPGDQRGLFEFLMITGVTGLALAMLAGWPLLLPPLLLAWILARETWRRMAPERRAQGAAVPFSGIGSRWGTKWSWQTNLIATLLPLSVVLAWGQILAANARGQLMQDSLAQLRERNQHPAQPLPVSVCRVSVLPFRVGVQLAVPRERGAWMETYRYLALPTGNMRMSTEGRLTPEGSHTCDPAPAQAGA